MITHRNKPLQLKARDYPSRPFHRHFLPLMVTACLLSSPSFAAGGPDAADAPVLRTNQQYLEESSRSTKLDVKNMLAVFEFVLNSLPEKVKVYPTENYYYFNFVHNGRTYTGNIRLAEDRDKGIVHFAFCPEYTHWRRGVDEIYRPLTASDGVQVEKKNELAYYVRFKGKQVLFELNDLSNVRPPEGFLQANEQFIGPIHDESGVQFFLVFNTEVKVFHYILNEAAPSDTFFTSSVADRIMIGNRTGFAFYIDKHRDRKILIGANQNNATVNNYFDGPFDQLPDNFIKGDELKNALIAFAPQLEGQIDRFGVYPGGESRYAIMPYIYWSEETDLAIVHECVTSKEAPAGRYYSCFALGDQQEQDAEQDGQQDGGEGQSQETPAQGEPQSPAKPPAGKKEQDK